jgi:predicted ATPase
MENFVTISGCSGGGKSTLLQELRQRGFATIAEPGRRIVAEELKRSGRALPWVDAAAFARRAIEVSLADLMVADTSARCLFFDRGLIDAAAALGHLTGEPVVVFLAPPWPEIYAPDQNDGTVSPKQLRNMIAWSTRSGYDIHVLPKVTAAERADWVLASLAR